MNDRTAFVSMMILVTAYMLFSWGCFLIGLAQSDSVSTLIGFVSIILGSYWMGTVWSTKELMW